LRRALHGGPDFVWVVLDPTGLWVVLGDLAITLPSDLSVEADRDRGRAGRALVQAQDDSANFAASRFG
jgi:hypothetical protein